MFKKIVATGLALVFALLFVAIPVSAATPNSLNYLQMPPHSNEEVITETTAAAGLEVIAIAIGAFSLTAGGMYEFGIFARNQGFDYGLCQIAIIAFAGGAMNPIGATIYLIAFDNGWNAA